MVRKFLVSSLPIHWSAGPHLVILQFRCANSGIPSRIGLGLGIGLGLVVGLRIGLGFGLGLGVLIRIGSYIAHSK